MITGRAAGQQDAGPPGGHETIATRPRSGASLEGTGDAASVALLSLPGERAFDERLARRDGKYLLGEELGEGGMGRVIAARDVELGRTVALKCLRTDTGDDPAMIKALLFEARVAGQLEHPHIVPVHG
ncbi:MAG: hypothetical protein QF464_21055, partial [Myxococcota bacterium]|nr:hypothetical protein [Myxococcota bacterium]